MVTDGKRETIPVDGTQTGECSLTRERVTERERECACMCVCVCVCAHVCVAKS